MYKNILIPIAADHGDVSEAIEISKAISAEGASLTALTVIEAVPSYVAGYLPEGQIEKTAKEVMTALKADLEGLGDVTPRVVSGHSANTILDYARQYGIDCIVISSHRPGLQDYFLGSTAARVVRHAQCAVHVIR
jgi:nucleotide-binding universal stress UspA family protein